MPRPPDRPDKPAERPSASTGLHPRNRHRGRYDFAALTAATPALSSFVVSTPGGEASIDFSDPAAIRALNRALLKTHYGIAHWDLPEGYLCPPIPGRADYLHGLADLLAASSAGDAPAHAIPRGSAVRVLDVGTGANLIYPLLGHREYGWRFVGTDIDITALRAAEAIADANGLRKMIELRHQPEPARVFDGLLRGDEVFDLAMCNPPFHASAADAAQGNQRKRRNLGQREAVDADARPSLSRPSLNSLNFGGQHTELWCTGGEAGFVRRMIRESAGIATRVCWFSSLIAKSEHLADVRKQLHQVAAQDVRVVAMAQGNKQSRFVAWTFLDAAQRDVWRASRWQKNP